MRMSIPVQTTPKTVHPAQKSILDTLRRSQSARYTQLRKPTGMDSDIFKFHIRKMVTSGFIEKMPSGDYRLTPTGKEFANNLSKHEPAVQKQPKLSVVVVASKPGVNGERMYLFQLRKRQPYFGFWSFPGGPVRWSEAIEDAAAREFHKQTGLDAKYEVRAFYRKRDYETDSGILLEDKLFAVVGARPADGELLNLWKGGENSWMTLAGLLQQKKYFVSAADFIEMLETDQPYKATDAFYPRCDY